MEITYTKYDDYYLPALLMPTEETATYGRFGRMHLKYLKEHRRVTYINLKTSGKLTHHLNEIDREANVMLQLLIEQMAQAQGITEQLKAENQMAWVGAMNNIRSAAEDLCSAYNRQQPNSKKRRECNCILSFLYLKQKINSRG